MLSSGGSDMSFPADGVDDFDVGQLRDLEKSAVLAGAGDEAALDLLMIRVRPVVRRYCVARSQAGASVTSIESAVQDVCRELVSELPSYRGDDSPFLSFLYRVAAHALAADRGHTTPDSELADKMHRLLDRLPAAQQAILVLRVSGGFSAPEAARLLGSTPGAVRVEQHRALCSLREMLADDVGEAVEPPPGRGGAAPAPAEPPAPSGSTSSSTISSSRAG